MFSLCVRLILDECASSSYLVFKEPTPNQVSPAVASPPHRSPPSGEPYKVITNRAPVNEDRYHRLFRTYDVNLMTPQQTPP
ncbi:uncharacterized protein METZ01_LOCUS511801, partial [marine metagenome]